MSNNKNRSNAGIRNVPTYKEKSHANNARKPDTKFASKSYTRTNETGYVSYKYHGGEVERSNQLETTATSNGKPGNAFRVIKKSHRSSLGELNPAFKRTEIHEDTITLCSNKSNERVDGLNRTSSSNFTTIFSRHDPHDDDKILTSALLKQARKTGLLALIGKGLVSIPEKVYELNEIENDASDKIHDLSVSEEDAWWNQQLMTSIDLSCNSILQIDPEIKKLATLTHLTLNENNLMSIPDEIGELEKLTCLNLKNNKLRTLPVSLYTLPNLKKLILSYNLFEEIHPSITDLHMLQMLDVSHNNIKEIPAGISFLSRLLEFILAFNKIGNLPPDLVILPSLKTLDLSHNILKELPDDMGNLRKLQIFTVQQNDLYTIPEFDGCDDLQEMNFSHNYIASIPPNLCMQLPHLRVLDVRNNRITELPSEICYLQSLKSLLISNNAIANLPCSLGRLPHLTVLQLEGNPIKSIRRDILQCGTSRILKSLLERSKELEQKEISTLGSSHNMSANGLDHSPRSISPGGGDGSSLFPDRIKMRKTRCLAVMNQNLTDVPEEVFLDAATERVTIFDFSKNRFTCIPGGFYETSECAIEVNFNNNMLSSVPAYIGRFKRISMLNLSCNQLTDLPIELSTLNSLRELNISNNRFEDLPQCLYKMNNLEILLVCNNRIKRIDATTDGLGALTRLATLDLRNNYIEQVPPILGNMRNIICLDLVGNPFRQPRHQILEKGTDAVMSYLRDRIPA